MFRKIVAATIVAVTLLSIPVHATPTGQYVRTGYIEDVDPVGGFTVLVTKDGNVWFWDGTTYGTRSGRKTLPVGGKVVIVFDGQNTHKPNDDVIIDFEIYER